MLRVFTHFPPSKIFRIAIVLTLFLALFLRTYHFSDRWGLGGDDTRDVLIAKEAILRGELPIIGSFSSAGPFVFGPVFYWFIMFSFVVYPMSLIAPWVMTVIMGMMTVGVWMVIGYLLKGRLLSIILGLLAATSLQFAYRSTALTQHTYVGVFASLLLMFFLLLWVRKKGWYAFLAGVSLGVALSLHYQSLNLLLFFPGVFFIPQVSWGTKVRYLFFMCIGFLLPSLPLLIWDAQQNFANVRNILDYMLIAQHRIYVPNSWRLFLFQYLPGYWLQVVGGNLIIAFATMCLSGLTVVFLFFRKKLHPFLMLLSILFGILVLVNRFYRGERSEGYLLYLAPFIFLFSGLFIHTILTLPYTKEKAKNLRENSLSFVSKVGKIVGTSFLLLLLLSNINENIILIHRADNKADEYHKAVRLLMETYPNHSFQLYDYEWINSSISYPLGAFLQEKGRLKDNGYPIAMICGTLGCPTNLPIITRVKGEALVDLRDIPVSTNASWVPVNPSNIYDDQMKWTKTEKLESPFSLTKYLSERLMRF